MSGYQIKLSARTVVELLSGILDQKKFIKDHNHWRSTDLAVFPFFHQQILNGRTLESVVVEKCPDRDDDWIVFTFKGPDAAISKFKIPKF